MLGLARVTVGTGRSDRRDDSRLRLDGLTAAEAAALRDELLHRPEPALAGEAAPEAQLAGLRPRWMAYGPFTLSGVLAIGVVAAFASHLASEAHVDLARFGPLRAAVDEISGSALAIAIVEVAVGSAVLVAAASTIGYALAFWGFRLTRNPRGTLHVTRGLVTTRATTIEDGGCAESSSRSRCSCARPGALGVSRSPPACGSAAAPSGAARCCCRPRHARRPSG